MKHTIATERINARVKATLEESPRAMTIGEMLTEAQRVLATLQQLNAWNPQEAKLTATAAILLTQVEEALTVVALSLNERLLEE